MMRRWATQRNWSKPRSAGWVLPVGPTRCTWQGQPSYLYLPLQRWCQDRTGSSANWRLQVSQKEVYVRCVKPNCPYWQATVWNLIPKFTSYLVHSSVFVLLGSFEEQLTKAKEYVTELEQKGVLVSTNSQRSWTQHTTGNGEALLKCVAQSRMLSVVGAGLQEHNIKCCCWSSNCVSCCRQGGKGSHQAVRTHQLSVHVFLYRQQGECTCLVQPTQLTALWSMQEL